MAASESIQAPKNVVRLGREPVLIRYDEATRFLWGDEESHQVSDWLYGRGERIASFMFSLRSGEYFRWSKTWKPLYNQHRLYYVLQGHLAIHDPETGDVAVANEGEAIFWRGEKWHFGYNFGPSESLILEGVAPPERGVDVPEVVFSEQKPDLGQVVSGRYDLLGKWPEDRPRARETTLLMKSRSMAWERPILKSLFASTTLSGPS